MTLGNTEPCDVVIIGAGPAGATAALMTARAGLSVLLLEGRKFPRTKPCAGWLNARAAAFIAEHDLPLRKAVRETIETVTFCNMDFSKTATPRLEAPTAFLIERPAFEQQLIEAAVKLGAVFRDEHPVEQIRPLEDGLEVTVRGDTKFTGRLLIVAAGLAPALLQQIGIRPPADSKPVWIAHVEQAKQKRARAGTPGRATLVTSASDENTSCLAIERPDRISITLHTGGEPSDVTTQLVRLAAGLAKRGHVPEDLSAAASRSPARAAYPFAALDLESHVGKHTLVIGDAGGFYAAVSHEGIYPAMWSAEIAARVIKQAATAAVSQDALMAFDTEWRLAMGDFLRPPNTDLQLLVPLIFTNQPMADRMAAAYFKGENI